MSQIPPPPQPPYPPQQQPYGQPQGVPGAYSMPAQRHTSAAAITSLVCGILGCIPFITGLLAVVCGFIGMRTTRDPRYSGRGMAVAGLILGLLSLLVWGGIGATAGLGGWLAYTHTKPAREAAKQFATDLAVGNVDAAHARCTSQVRREDLVTASAKIKKWGPLQDTTMPVGSVQTINGLEEAFVAGVATFSGTGGVPYAVGFKKEGGTLKVNGFMFTHNDEMVTAGVEPKQKETRFDLD